MLPLHPTCVTHASFYNNNSNFYAFQHRLGACDDSRCLPRRPILHLSAAEEQQTATAPTERSPHKLISGAKCFHSKQPHKCSQDLLCNNKACSPQSLPKRGASHLPSWPPKPLAATPLQQQWPLLLEWSLHLPHLPESLPRWAWLMSHQLSHRYLLLDAVRRYGFAVQ